MRVTQKCMRKAFSAVISATMVAGMLPMMAYAAVTENDESISNPSVALDLEQESQLAQEDIGEYQARSNIYPRLLGDPAPTTFEQGPMKFHFRWYTGYKYNKYRLEVVEDKTGTVYGTSEGDHNGVDFDQYLNYGTQLAITADSTNWPIGKYTINIHTQYYSFNAWRESPKDMSFGFSITASAANGGSQYTRPAHTGNTANMYRMYNPNSGEHFYTASADESISLEKAGWKYEDVAWVAPAASQTPVYRMYSGTDHHYTTDAAERDWLQTQGWSYEGVGWYSDDAKGVLMHRLFNPGVDPSAPTNNSGSHHYTASKAEVDSLVAVGWQYEGESWYGCK